MQSTRAIALVVPLWKGLDFWMRWTSRTRELAVNYCTPQNEE
jgi:hypothetical protein